MKKCPQCAEEIKAEAVVCRYCGRESSSSDKVARNAKIAVYLLLGLTASILFALGMWNLIGPISPGDKKDVVQTMAAIAGGIGAGIGLYFTSQTLKTNQATLHTNRRTTQRTLEISQRGQITDRFTKAIDQLGHDELEVCLGGVYALEQIAKDSLEDERNDYHWPTMEVLTAYVREHAPWKPETDSIQKSSFSPFAIGGYIRESDLQETKEASYKDDTPISPPLDVQAILTVIGRRHRPFEPGKSRRLNLRQSDLRGAYLGKANLKGVNLSRSNLEKANLGNADLEHAKLWYTHLEEANFQGASLKHAWLRNVTGLRQEQLEQANGNEHTLLPAGFDRPSWWKTTENELLIPGETYSTKVFKPALSFTTSGYWHAKVRAPNSLILTYRESKDAKPDVSGNLTLSFLNVREVYPKDTPEDPSVDAKEAAPPDMEEWFREHQRLTFEKLGNNKLGGKVGAELHLRVKPPLNEVILFPLYTRSERILWFRLFAKSKNYVVVLNFGDEKVIVCVEIDVDKFEEIYPKARELLKTVNWET